ncbi:MATE family efflux transporter [Saprospira grandis]|uniref:MATE family efflux transporter n=1 Tax=Saprospira grandis TaxID=1008 RepID=UPI0022DE45C5|nr:MATE family efflux transporter [Saprospira grandis]WBM75286.1 MATE family efflux transporter [Saprospira grandis]
MITYKRIFQISMPIMVGSAVQNLITLTDTIFLGRVGKVELGAIGLVGVFYLLITSIGYSFTKAGQIMIARRIGADQEKEIGPQVHAMGIFAFLLALLMFFLLAFGSRTFFGWFVTDPDIYEACIAYLDYRCYGVFFSYLGVAFVAMYTGLARTTVIIYNAVVMGIANTILNYGLIFGHFGLPEMGISGAALASTLAEVLAFGVFIIYVLLDKKCHDYQLFKWPELNIELIKAQLRLSGPIVLQSIASVGSWFVFFALIEQLGQKELAVSNIIRAAYMIYMIPAWGFSSGINTIVSQLIGQEQSRSVMTAIYKTAILCFVVTMLVTSSVVIAPDYILRIGTDDPVLIREASKLVWVLVTLITLYSFSTIYFNGLVGTGATKQSLLIQVSSVLLYMLYAYIVVGVFRASLEWAWMTETVYWIACLAASAWYLRSKKWVKIKI